MREFQEKNKFRQALYSKLSIAFLLILCLVVLRGVYGVYQKQRLSQENLERTQKSFDSLEEREAKLLAEVDRLQSDRGREEEIREKYGFVKPGEEIIVIVDEESDDRIKIKIEEGFWSKVRSWFGF